MILLTKGESADRIVVTLNEKRTLTSGYYLFVFTNETTQTVVNKIYNFVEDESSYPERFNQFEIDTETLFGTKSTGFWTYKVYEQVSATNTDVTGLTEVESGIMKLQPATEFAYEAYNGATSFKQYAG